MTEGEAFLQLASLGIDPFNLPSVDVSDLMLAAESGIISETEARLRGLARALQVDRQPIRPLPAHELESMLERIQSAIDALEALPPLPELRKRGRKPPEGGG